MPALGFKLPDVTPKIEDVACQMMTKQFKMLMDTIDKIFATLRWPFEVLCSLIHQFKTVMINTFQDVMFEIKDSAQDLVDFAFGPVNQVKDDLCLATYKCRAFIDNMTNPKKSPLYLTGLCSKDTLKKIEENYDDFSKWICNGPGLGEGIKQLAAMINQFLSDLCTFCTEMLDLAMAKILEWKDKFEKLLEKAGIFELLNQLKAFMSCALGVCDFTYSARNAYEDYKARYYLVEKGEAFEFNLDIVDELNENKNDMLSDMKEALNSYPKW